MNFTQFLLVLKARSSTILTTWLVIVMLTAAISFLLPREYTASTNLVVDFKAPNAITGILQPSQLLPGGYLATQSDIVGSHTVALKVVDNLRLIQDTPTINDQFQKDTDGKGTIRDWLADNLLKKLEVEPSRESSIIAINYTAANPQFAAIIANAFAQAYVETNLELKVEPAQQTAKWFDQQIKQLRNNLEEAQAKMSAYQRETGIVLSDERLDVETARLTDISQQLVSAQSAAFDAFSRQSQKDESPDVTNNALVQNLKSQLAQSEANMSEVAKKSGINNPEYQRALAQLNSNKQQLENSVRSAAKSVVAAASSARQREIDLRATLAAQKAKVLELKKQHDEIALLQSDVENAQHIYDTALQRAGQNRMEAQSNQTDVSILNPATPPIKYSKPRILINIVLAVFMGGFLGVCIAFLMELLDRRIRSKEDIIGVLGLPVLGISGQRSPSRRWGASRFRAA